MDFENVVFKVEDNIAVITINRPKALNALNEATVKELNSCVDLIEADSEVRVVVITGAGEKSFVAGADITEMATKTPAEGRAWGRFGQFVFSRIEDLPMPVIAAVNGFALGGGCELACACDFRYAADNAKFGQPEVGLGITPGFGGTQRVARVIGRGMAKELIYTAKLIDANEAYRVGLVNKVVPLAELMPAVVKTAKKIANNAKVAVQMSKIAINRGIEVDTKTGVAYEGEVFGLCFATADQKEGMAAFVEKRKPVFTGK